MTKEEARKQRDEQIADVREWVRNSDDAWEYSAVLSVIDEIVDEIKLCDKHLEALQERPKGRWFEQVEIICDVPNEEYREEIYYNCLECDCSLHWKAPFCPNCGADMRESE